MTRAPLTERAVPEDLGAAAAWLRETTAAGEAELAGLPDRPDRGPDRQLVAERVHRSCRTARWRFLRAHAAAVYERLTDGLRERPRITALAARAAEEYPGLCPTDEQMAAERRCARQADKEGREIDQALLIAALLDAETGAHLTESMRRPTDRALSLLPDFRASGRLELGAADIERDGAAATVTLRNPDCLNAEDDRLAADLETAVDLALLDDAVEVGVLRGAETNHRKYAGRRVFCAGINLTELYRGGISMLGFLLGRELGLIAKLVRGLSGDDPDPFAARSGEKPWVGAVDAFAIGGGMQLLFACDRVIAETDAFFRLPAAREGIVPGAANLRIGRGFDARESRRLLLFGESVPAGDPMARGICDATVEPDRMDGAIAAAADVLASPAVRANRRMLRLAEEPEDRFRAYMADFAATQARRVYDRDVLDNLERAWMRRAD